MEEEEETEEDEKGEEQIEHWWSGRSGRHPCLVPRGHVVAGVLAHVLQAVAYTRPSFSST